MKGALLVLLALIALSSPVLAQLCDPEFIEVTPPSGATGVPVDHGINMVFGPRSDSCLTMCWDTTTFSGWLMVCVPGAACDTVELDPGDVEFWFGDVPNVGIEYHCPYPVGWPAGAEIHGGWVIADCDSDYADGSIYFHVVPDSTPTDCDMGFYGVYPLPGATVLDAYYPITMTFGPDDTTCSFCRDTSSFEGQIIIASPGFTDTLLLSSSDVDWNDMYWPIFEIIYTPPLGWPDSADISADFYISDCDSNRAHGLTWFWTRLDSGTTPTDCDIAFYGSDPRDGSMGVPVDADISMFFGPADSSCDSFCVDTSTFEGVIHVGGGPIMPSDTIFVGSGDVDFDFSAWPVVEVIYDSPTDWPLDAEINAYFAFSDCGGHREIGETDFYTLVDGVCSIAFYNVLPAPGTMDVDSDVPVQMVFGPEDPACTSFCVDTTTFEGIIVFTDIPYTGARDTIFLDPGDVDFDFSTWPVVEVIYDPPTDWPDSTEIFAGFHISDCDSNRAHGTTWFYTMPDSVGSFDVVWFTPPDSVWSACGYQPLTFRVEPYVPDALELIIMGSMYIVGIDSEISVFGDTVVFTPSTPWLEGPYFAFVLDEFHMFGIDLTDPVMFPIYPADGATVPLLTGGVEVTYNIHDVYSGIDESSISVVVMVDGTLEGTFGVSHTGVDYLEPDLTINLEDVGVVLVPGDSVTLIISASDLVSSEYCGPNMRVEDLRFTVCDPVSDRHYLVGHVVDAGSGDSISGIIVLLFGYLAGPIPGMVDTTDIDGEYSFDVYPGTYTIGAFDTIFVYRPIFYLDRLDFLEADPIYVTVDDPDTIPLDTLHMIPRGPYPSLSSISGTIMEEADGPIDAAYVVAISSEDDEIQDAVITGPTGDYNLLVPVGDYYVLAFHYDYCPAFYGGSFDYFGATEVVLTTSGVIGIDIELIPIYGGGDRFLCGYILGDSTGRCAVSVGIRGVRIYAVDVETDRPVGAAVSDFEGYYNIDCLLPGTYRVYADRNGYVSSLAYSAIDIDGAEFNLDIGMIPTTSVAENPIVVNWFELESLTPNPFNSSCAVGYSITDAGEVQIDVVDISGRVVSTMVDRYLKAGDYVTVWDPENLPSGTYLINIKSGGVSRSAKALYIK